MEIGEKLKRLRLTHQLTQEELANRAELSKGFISQIERELTSPSIATLTDILQCLGTDLKEFFSDFGDDQVVFEEKDYFTKEEKVLGSEMKWLIPNAQKNMMEPVLLTLKPKGTSMVDEAHVGEEFGYVENGHVIIHVGEMAYTAVKGQSFYYVANKSHYIENVGEDEAIIVWVSSPPYF